MVVPKMLDRSGMLITGPYLGTAGMPSNAHVDLLRISFATAPSHLESKDGGFQAAILTRRR